VQNNLEAWEMLLHPEDREHAFARVDAYLEGQLPNYELEHRLRHKDGSYRWILARGVALRPAGGVPTRMVGSHVDITDRRLVEERLRRVNADLAQREIQLRATLTKLESAHHELKSTQLQLIQAAKLESVGKLAAGVAHEVKNPLQTMLMGLIFIERSLAAMGNQSITPESQKELRSACKDMHEAIDRANAIIRELLQMSGTPNLKLEPTDLNALLKKTLSLVNYQLNSCQVTAQCELQPNLPRLGLDEGKIEQVFINLFTNAIHAMPDGGTLIVRTYLQPAPEAADSHSGDGAGNGHPDTEVVAEVCDTGTGIPDDKMEMLFCPFFTTKEKGLGTGLGLSVTRSIVELHGGRIELVNRPEGGARAILRFNTGRKQSP
jgi:signal transduction histidine kinase